MKNYLGLVAAILLFASCEEQQKIGYVDNVKLVNEYQEKIDIEADLKGKISQYEKRRDSLGQVFQLEIREAEQKASKMSPQDLQKLQQEFQQKEQILTQKLQFEQGQISQESRTRNDTLKNKIMRFVEKYGKDNGYTYILGKNEGGSVMFGTDENDLTEEILEKLNAEYTKE